MIRLGLREFFFSNDFKTWVLRNTIFVVIYAILAMPMYDIINSIYPQGFSLATPLDDAIPPIWEFAIVYVFIFYPFVLYTIAYFAYIKPKRSLRFFASLFVIYLISFITYIVFPVEMVARRNLYPNTNYPSPNSQNFFERVMAKYFESDKPLNCFPSLHAANSSIAAYYLSKEKPKYSYIFWGIAILVMISTLFVRQHVIADEIAGFLVAIFAGKISEKYLPEQELENKAWLWRVVFALLLATLVTVYLLTSYI